MSTITPMPMYGGPRAVVAAEVRALMGRHNKTQTDIAALLHVKQPQVSARLRGVTAFDVDELALLAEFFGVSIGSLFGETTIRRPDGPDGGVGADDEIRTRNILLGSAKVVPLFGAIAA